jgi:2-dehydropantoate 2-reductase
MHPRTLTLCRRVQTHPVLVEKLHTALRSSNSRDPPHRGRASSGRCMSTQHPSSTTPAARVAESKARNHVLGIGNIGKLFAHALATQESASPITLLLHRPGLLKEWEKAGRSVEIVTGGLANQDGRFDVEVVGDTDGRADVSDTIQNLIVTTKATKAAAAVSSVKERLARDSTILFAQNGMGTVEEINSLVFPDVTTRPHYLACVNSHGLFSRGPFSSVHAGFGTVAIGRTVPTNHDEIQSHGLHGSDKPSYLLGELVRSPLLHAREVSPVELLHLQVEKLVINSIINPLTVIFNCRNGEILTDRYRARLLGPLLSQASEVIRSLPELQDDVGAQERFSTSRLEAVVREVAEKTAENTSSMLQDVRAGRQTEIDYINGYIVRRAAEVGKTCTGHAKLIQLVKQGQVIDEQDIGLHFPLSG